MIKRSVSIIAILLFLGFIPLKGTDMHLPEDNPIYPFLLAMETRGLLNSPLPATRPWIKSDVAGHLKILLNKRDSLNSTERDILQMLVNRYRPELSDLKHPRLSDADSVYTSLLHLREDIKRKISRSLISEPDYFFLYDAEDEYLFLQGDGLLRLENKNDLFRYSGHVGIRGFAQLGKFSAFGDAMAYGQIFRDGFLDDPIDSRGYYTHTDSTLSLATFDNAIGYIQLKTPGGLFTLGNDFLRWGYGENSMTLSGNTAPFPYMMWQKNFYRSRFTFFHGSLLNAKYTLSEDGHSRIYPEKFLAGHRLEIYPLRNLSFAFSEFVVYGSRNVELTYLIPAVFIWSAEHNLNDRDNILMSFETKWQPIRGVKFHGNIFLDELDFSELGTNWWGNKHGTQIGLNISLPFISAGEFFFERTQVRPWTYTHYKEVNTFSHKGDCLGFFAGPNSRVYTLGIRGWLNAANNFIFSFQSIEKGKEPFPDDHPDYYPVGSDANQNYYDRNKTFDYSTKNLMGDIQQSFLLNIEWQLQMANNVWLRVIWHPCWTDEQITHYGRMEVQVKH